MASKLFSLYSKLPVWAQNLACSAAGIQMRRQRFGKPFRNYLAFLDESQWWPLSQQQSYQDEQVKQVIRHAYDTVPYYRCVMDERHLSPDDITCVADLPKLPILTKQMVRQLGTELCSTAIEKSQWVGGHTGGTTGTAMQLFYQKDSAAKQWAIWWRHRERFGLNQSDEFIVFAGRDVIPISQMDPPFWRRNRTMHQTYVSIHHMTKANMKPLVDYLQTRKVKFYSGYPSAVYLVAQYLVEHEITLPHPPEVTCLGAETLLPHQKAMMEKAWGGVITDQYGASEGCGNISECESRRYHVDMEFGAIELLPLEHVPATTRRIICTGFCNPVMPLIRYDIGDIATVPEHETPCPCGRQSPQVERIDGRIESYILTPDGRQAGRLDFLFKDSAHIEEAQLVQHELESVTIKIVRNDHYTTQDEEALLTLTRRYLGDVIRIDLEYVSAIPRTSNGKFRQIVSTIFAQQQSLMENS
jgi:phenylacetate-CoA ligase